MNRKTLPLALLAVAIGAVAAGCGGSESAQAPTEATTAAPTRQAAAGDTRTCPPKTGFTYKATIWNLLAVPIRLEASEYDCNDWDGMSTPGRAFTGQVIQPGDKRTFTLQPAENTVRNWTMEFTATSGVPSFGRARLFLRKQPIYGDRSIEVYGSTRTDLPDGEFSFDSCRLLPMERTGAPATPRGDIETVRAPDIQLISRGGFITLATNCTPGVVG